MFNQSLTNYPILSHTSAHSILVILTNNWSALSDQSTGILTDIN